jgi:hypothetical protein
VRPDQQDLIANLRLVVIAAVSAVVTATLVIGVGRNFLPQITPEADAPLVVTPAIAR